MKGYNMLIIHLSRLSERLLIFLLTLAVSDSDVSQLIITCLYILNMVIMGILINRFYLVKPDSSIHIHPSFSILSSYNMTQLFNSR